MFKSKKGLLLVSAAVIFAQSGQAIAAGADTNAGTPVANTATVTYAVGGTTQPTATSNTDSFVVDRKVNLTVTEADTASTVVTLGQTNAVTTFTVQNLTNGPLDLRLSATQIATGSPTPRGTDAFNLATGPFVFVESGTTPGYQPAEDTATFIDELAEDGIRTVYIVGNIPGSLPNGQYAGVVLTAVSATPGSAGLGADLTNNSGAAEDKAVVQNVFADAAANGDAAGNGQAYDDDDYRVSAPVITVNKASRVVNDGLGTTTNAKAIPGATIEYCIAVTNGGDSAATGVNVSDNIPANTTYVAGSARTDATVTGSGASAVCTVGTATGTTTTGSPVTNVSGTIASVPASGGVVGFYFRVTIN